MRIKITLGKLEVFARLNESKTAGMIGDSLPFEAKAELWGDEVYFFVKPKIDIEKKFVHEVVRLGDMGYWPKGPCMCLFFGMTPNSRDGKIMPASAVNVFGKLEGDPKVLSSVKEGDFIKVERV
jgi:hypothetical protein